MKIYLELKRIGYTLRMELKRCGNQAPPKTKTPMNKQQKQQIIDVVVAIDNAMSYAKKNSDTKKEHALAFELSLCCAGYGKIDIENAAFFAEKILNEDTFERIVIDFSITQDDCQNIRQFFRKNDEQFWGAESLAL